MPELVLSGCRPEPLAHYLKAIGILRLVAEQVDREARGSWRGDTFVLASSLDRAGLVGFLVEAYRPTPVVAPWNGGSGFWPKDNRDGFDALRASTVPRFAAYREAIDRARIVIAASGLTTRPDGEEKARFVAALRAELPDEALDWMDAALVLTPDGARFPPLLGTGGNDGRLDFSNNQMQRLAELFLSGAAPDGALAAAALFDEPVAGLRDLTIGQFLPSGSGGTNGGPGFEGKGAVNPWDYVLMLEGALLPSAAATRRLEASRGGALAFPFTVRSSGVGYGSAAARDEQGSRDEIWLPLWSGPATLPAVRALFVEGRATVPTSGGRSTAVTGTDFARALASLGVDRGVDRFVRYGFLQRNGLAYLATPLGVHHVQHGALVDVLSPLDGWLDRLRAVGTDDRAPSSWKRARLEVERAVLDLCTGRDTRLDTLLFALAAAERALARQVDRAIEKGARPVPPLPASAWMPHLVEDSPAFRLGAALASSGYRRRVVPVKSGRWEAERSSVTFGGGSAEADLVATLARVAVERSRGEPEATPGVFARLPDIEAWLDARVDEAALSAWTHALSLLDGLKEPPSLRPSGRSPSASWAACALAWDRRPRPRLVLPDTPALPSLLVADRVSDASALALSRLRSSGLVPATDRIPAARGSGRRLASALLFPISPADKAELLASLGVAEPEPLSPAE